MDFPVSVKLKESKKRDKYIDLARELKKSMEHEGDGDINCTWRTWNKTQRIGKGLKDMEIRGDHPDYSITKIGQNAEESPGNLRRLAVTQIPVRDYQLTLV